MGDRSECVIRKSWKSGYESLKRGALNKENGPGKRVVSEIVRVGMKEVEGIAK